MATRKTAQDLRKEHEDLQLKTLALEARIKNRLKELIIAHPDAIVGYSVSNDGNVPLKAKGLNSDYYLNNMSISSTLQYIEIIERYLADQHPHKQLNLYDDENKS